jgi:RimJ/RimL family protein N-acetyltransferase
MSFELQPRMENALIRLVPLEPDDFDALFAVAADPLLWEQHPSKNRYQRAVFETFFKGALESGGAFCVWDNVTGELIGSSRYYDWDAAQCQVCIGYTFIARSTWGRLYNTALKTLMLDHAFRCVERVVFHVGADNRRSRRAMEKLGGACRGEVAMSYNPGEPVAANVIYEITRDQWCRSPARYGG